jgi:hypothetical protein
MGRRRHPPGGRFPEKLTFQVCSPALALKLKAVGVPQDSLWYWLPSRGDHPPLLAPAAEVAAHPLFQTAAASAFTAGELGELLPSAIEQAGEVLHFLGRKSARTFSVAYVLTPAEGQSGIERGAATEAEARGQMLLYLIENQLVSP